MAIIISNVGDLKSVLSSSYLFHTRLVSSYDLYIQNFETDANARLRVLPMETRTLLTTANGDAPLPADYLAWRSVRPTLVTLEPVFHAPFEEIDYVHPAYLPPVGRGLYQLFTIEADTLRIRPVNDNPNAYEFRYYAKIPSLAGAPPNDTNWLLSEWPSVYLFGLLVEAAAAQRNAEMAQLYKARRDEVFQEIVNRYALTTGASSPRVRVAEYY